VVSEQIRILLAEDMTMIRAALVTLINHESDLLVVAEVERGDAVVEAARLARPDVAVLDLRLPGLDGLGAAAALRAEQPDCRCLILTALSTPGVMRRALKGGVDGVLRKDAHPSELSTAVRRVHGGQRVVDPDLAHAAWIAVENPLSNRETETLRLAADGLDSRDIARSLYLSVGTVRNYLSSAVGKVGARNRVDAIRIAREEGWLV
jgi:two-component system response regulator DesR